VIIPEDRYYFDACETRELCKMEIPSKCVWTLLDLLRPESHDTPNRFGNRREDRKRILRVRVTVGGIAVFLLIVAVVTVAAVTIAEATDYFVAEAAT